MGDSYELMIADGEIPSSLTVSFLRRLVSLTPFKLLLSGLICKSITIYPVRVSLYSSAVYWRRFIALRLALIELRALLPLAIRMAEIAPYLIGGEGEYNYIEGARPSRI